LSSSLSTLFSALLRSIPGWPMAGRLQAGSKSAAFSVADQEFWIRELDTGGLGVRIYPSGKKLLEMLPNLTNWADAHVLELGAGTGLISVALAKLGARVYATDYEKDTLKNLRFNIHQNRVAGQVQVWHWDWAAAPPDQLPLDKLQYCVGSDLVLGSNSSLLCKVLKSLKASAPGMEIMLVLHEREAEAVRALEEELDLVGIPFNREPLGYPGCAADEHVSDNGPGTLSLLRI